LRLQRVSHHGVDVPSRPTRILIVLFWLTTAGWYVQREIMPYWTADAAPTFAVDLTDEALRQSLPVTWSLSRAGHKVCPIRTTVEYHGEEDEFSLHCVVWKLELVPGLTIDTYRGSYRVTRQGRLVESKTIIAIGPDQQIQAKLTITAKIIDGNALVKCQLQSSVGAWESAEERKLVGDIGTLNPLHPVHKLSNLRVGQRWTQPMSDPVAEAQRAALLLLGRQLTGVNLQQLFGESAPKSLIAEVTGPAPFEWHGHLHNCYVIEYRGDGHTASTWVRVSDGWVLRQEASANGDKWELQRD
jgi:hypothetical protein